MTKLPRARKQRQRFIAPLSPISSKLTLAELSLQRGEFAQASRILEKRIGLGNKDPKTRNLYGVSLAQLGLFDQALAVFDSLLTRNRAKSVAAAFNKGLVLFYIGLQDHGDLSISQFSMASIHQQKPQFEKPFLESVDLWEAINKRRSKHEDIINVYLAFAYLQAGNFDLALKRVITSLKLNENFYVTHYILGRIFFDLYILALDECNYGLSHEASRFFEVEDYEVLRPEEDRIVLQTDTYLDISMQAFLESRSLNSSCPENHYYLCRSYLMAGLVEEAFETLGIAETLTPDALPFLQTSLMYHQLVASPPEVQKSFLRRIERYYRKNAKPSHLHILPPYYLY